MIPTQVTYTGPARTYRCGKLRIKKGESAMVDDPELLNYLLTNRGFRVVEKRSQPAPPPPAAPPAEAASAPADPTASVPQPAPAEEPAPAKGAGKERKARRILRRGNRGGGK
jgi:hypothetical protein